MGNGLEKSALICACPAVPSEIHGSEGQCPFHRASSPWEGRDMAGKWYWGADTFCIILCIDIWATIIKLCTFCTNDPKDTSFVIRYSLFDIHLSSSLRVIHSYLHIYGCPAGCSHETQAKRCSYDNHGIPPVLVICYSIQLLNAFDQLSAVIRNFDYVFFILFHRPLCLRRKDRRVKYFFFCR